MLVNIKINGKDYQADSSLTILKVCRRYHIHIPTLCYMFHEETNLEHKPASCRVCVVEVKGRRNLVPACATTVYEGMEVTTNSLKCMEYRKNVVELLLSNHPNDCVYCAKNNKCELQALAAELGIRRVHYHGELSQKNEYHNARGLLKNPAKCILCNRCTAVCSEVQSIEAIVPTMRGFKTVISTPNKCITCGQCIQVCPTGALIQQDDTLLVEKALADKDKYVIVNTAPAVRVSLGDEFGLPAGTTADNIRLTVHMNDGFNKAPQMTIGKMRQSEDLNLSASVTDGKNTLYDNQQVGIVLDYDMGAVSYASNYAAGTGFCKTNTDFAKAKLDLNNPSKGTFIKDQFVERMKAQGYDISAEDYAAFSSKLSGKNDIQTELRKLAVNGQIDFNGKQIPVEQVEKVLFESTDDLMHVSYEMRGIKVENGFNEVNVYNPEIKAIYVRGNSADDTIESILSADLLNYAQRRNLPIIFQRCVIKS